MREIETLQGVFGLKEVEMPAWDSSTGNMMILMLFSLIHICKSLKVRLCNFFFCNMKTIINFKCIIDGKINLKSKN